MWTKKELKGKKFLVERTIKDGILTVDDIPAMREQYQNQVDDFCEKTGKTASMTETEDAFKFSNGQFVMKPKYEKVKIDTLDCKSTFMKFGSVRIEYDGLVFSDDGFGDEMGTYRIIKGIGD